MIQQVTFGSDLYKHTLAFRDRHLRRPIGLVLSDADIEGEAAQWHFAAVETGTVIATVILKPVSGAVVKLRQMAVHPRARGSGLGRELVRFAEAAAVSRGVEVIEMMARVDAMGFYEKLGYDPLGEPLVELGIPHLKMAKRVSTKPVP